MCVSHFKDPGAFIDYCILLLCSKNLLFGKKYFRLKNFYLCIIFATKIYKSKVQVRYCSTLNFRDFSVKVSVNWSSYFLKSKCFAYFGEGWIPYGTSLFEGDKRWTIYFYVDCHFWRSTFCQFWRFLGLL